MTGLLSTRRFEKIVVATVFALAPLLVVGCGAGGGSESVGKVAPRQECKLPHEPPYICQHPPPEAICRMQRTWPDNVHFLTADQVTRRFKEKTGYALERAKGGPMAGARTLVRFSESRERALRRAAEKAGDVFSMSLQAWRALHPYGQFTLNIVDPTCPALIRWLGAEGEPGEGGLVWEFWIHYGCDAWTDKGRNPIGSCWFGHKRYPRSNLVVDWEWGKPGPREVRAWERWWRLDATLTQIAAGR